VNPVGLKKRTVHDNCVGADFQDKEENKKKGENDGKVKARKKIKKTQKTAQLWHAPAEEKKKATGNGKRDEPVPCSSLSGLQKRHKKTNVRRQKKRKKAGVGWKRPERADPSTFRKRVRGGDRGRSVSRANIIRGDPKNNESPESSRGCIKTEERGRKDRGGGKLFWVVKV